MPASFPKRHYRSPGAFWRDFRAMSGNRTAIRDAMRGLDPAFRERLMLAVTGVNGCRMCSYFHAKAAVEMGLTGEEVKAMLARDTGRAPEKELPALLYAQHYAESGGRPTEAVRTRMTEIYGVADAGRIDTILRMIQTANLLGNTWDYSLYRVSGGRWGLPSTSHT
jgi:AhpD family alkylhydroperoxidase